ncbi:Uncharacterized protein Adt_21292 [Abeliophyllum distichum]|uniref:Uncharacterized protein n=1 Tax=Abeliophyllum distichum TaxID=126358 RepID=A0ABD1SYY2_9LAMI
MDYRDDPLNYVHECYRVNTYLRCYENLVMPINGKRLWPEVDKLPIKPPGWILTKRGRRQKKRRKQQEEDVMIQSQGTTKLKKKGSVVMTCSVCGLTGHNKRYHDKEDAPHEDWSALPVEPLLDSQNTSTTQTRPKLQARRSKKNRKPTSEDQPQPSEFQFMPTPGFGHDNDPVHNSGPAVYNPEAIDVVEVQPHSMSEG